MEKVTGKQIVPKLVCTVAIGGVTLWTLYKILLHWKRKVQVYRQQKYIVVIETAEDWNKFYDNFILDRDIKVVGFDCEWVFKGHSRHPVSLIQIATQHGDCALIRILNIHPNIPESLKSVLANKRILKVGVAAKDDGQKLLHDFGLEVYGCVDLRFLLNRIRGIYKCKTRGLQGLSQGVLGIKMKKDVKIRCGNWEAEKLSPQQIEYAADDAIIAVDIFTHLILAKMNGKKPNLKDISDTGIYITETGFWKITKSMCQGILDVGYKWRSLPVEAQESGDLTDDCVAETNTKTERNTSDPKSVQPVVKNPRAYVTRKRPLYYNCSLLAPDGEMLCTCDIRKAEWYIMKGLADKVSDDPLTVKLRFEPSGRPNDELNYYLQYKENVCVVCGKDDSYIRKLVVPKEYRKYFPPSLKNHSSHDVLLMCVSCHMISTQYDNALRNQLANECSAPINSSARSTQDHDLQKIKAAAKALVLNKEKIPKKRVLELEGTVKNFYGVTELTDDILKIAMEIDIRIYNQDYSPHGEKVVKYMVKHGGLHEFERRWRQHFLDTMNPKFMPDLWSVEHRNEHYFNPEEMNSVTDKDEEKMDNSSENNSLSLLRDIDGKRIVWIVGSSLVYWAEQRSRYKNNPNLGLDELQVDVKWCGIRGARWESLIPELNNKMMELPTPDALIVHLGSNDITSIDTDELIKNMKLGFKKIQEMFPDTSLMFSELVSRRKWRGISVQEGERRRNLVNKKMSDYILKMGGFVIPHTNITNDLLELYREDGVHLSALGDDILLEDFTDALKDYFMVSFDGI